MTSEAPRNCPPRYATPRTSSRQTAGRYATGVAKELGLPFMPWQQQVMDTALEIEDGQFVYREVIVTVPRQSGKSTALLSLILTRALMLSSQRIVYALALDTPIPTPSGWTTMGDVQVGDYVFGADGHPTRVLEVSAVHLNSPCRRVTFNDKTSIVASDDHLWETRKYGGSIGVRSTDEIAKTLKVCGGRQNRHYVRTAAALKLPNVDLPIDPYIFGRWLGDGDAGKASINVGTTDLSHLLSESVKAGYETTVSCPRDDEVYKVQLTIGGVGYRGRCIDSVRSRLNMTGALHDKHIPDLYLRASLEQRTALLQGLMDSDGTIARHTCEIRLTVESLAQGALELVRGLGIRANRTFHPGGKRVVFPQGHVSIAKDLYGVAFGMPENVVPSRLSRKLEPYARKVVNRREDRSSWRSIVSAERVDSVPTKCIKVDASDSLYLAGESLIPTHNTAQTRADARKLWFETWMPVVQASKFSEHFKARLANGDESLLFDNGSRQGLVASTMKAGHGQTLDLAIVDEAFSQADSRLEQALKPAMVTRSKQPHRGPQLWVVSTAGTLNASPYLWNKVENGRVLAESGHNKHVAYFEWSASEDDDPTDEETWWRCMPALGRTATLDAVRADYLSMELHEFMRAYLNCWTSISIDPVIPLSAWTALARSDLDTTGVSVAIAADITPSRDYSSVAASGTLADGRQFVEVLAHRPGTDWVAGFVEKLVESNDVTSVVVDPAGPAVTLIDPLQRRGINFDGGLGKQVTTREHADAFSSLCDAVVEADKDNPLFVHTGQRDLTLALDGAVSRDVGDGAKAWGRKNSGVDISPLVAGTLAFWGAREDQRGNVWSLDEIVAQLRTEKQTETPSGPPEENPGGLYYTPI